MNFWSLSYSVCILDVLEQLDPSKTYTHIPTSLVYIRQVNDQRKRISAKCIVGLSNLPYPLTPPTTFISLLLFRFELVHLPKRCSKLILYPKSITKKTKNKQKRRRKKVKSKSSKNTELRKAFVLFRGYNNVTSHMFYSVTEDHNTIWTVVDCSGSGSMGKMI